MSGRRSTRVSAAAPAAALALVSASAKKVVLKANKHSRGADKPRAAKKAKLDAAATADASEGDDEDHAADSDGEGAAAAASIAAFSKERRAATAAAQPRNLKFCQTCTLAYSGHAAAWLCSACGLRGDLPASDAANVILHSQHHTAAVAASFSPAPSVASTTSGQASATAAAAAALTHLDRQFNAVTALGITAAFTVSDTPLTQAFIDAELRRSLHAPRHPPTTPALRAMLRAGRCADVGFALERTAASVQEDALHNTGTLTMVNTQITTSSKFTVAPVLESPTDLLAALVSTIGPSLLVHNPAALLQWFMLVRTVLAINSDPALGWVAAREYMHMTLNERMLDGLSLSPVDVYTLHSVTMAAAARRSASAAAPQQQQPLTSQPRSKAKATPRAADAAPAAASSRSPASNAAFQLCRDQGICNNFNFGASGCAEPCHRKLKHACPYRAAHGCTTTDTAHRGQQCSHRPITSGNTH